MRVLPLILLLLSPACADAQTSTAPAPTTVERAYQAALLHSPTPLSVRRDQAEYQRERAESPGPEFMEASEERRLAVLQRSAAVDRKGIDATARLEDVVGGCVDLGAIDGCRARTGGWLTPRQGPRLFWQVQVGSTAEDGITAGVVFLVEKAGRLEPVAWAWQGSSYDAPRVFDGAGGLYIAVPGRSMGAGRGDADLIFRWTPEADKPLTQIDSWSWRDEVTTQLPGLFAYGRVRIDYDEMIALTEMFRESDAGCCGTGGHALISFAIRGDRLAVSDAQLRDR